MVECVIEKCTGPLFPSGRHAAPREREGEKVRGLRHKEPPEGFLALLAEEDGIEVGWRRLGKEGVEALPGCLRRVDGTAVGKAFDVGTADLGDLAGTGDGVVVEEAPEVAKVGAGAPLGDGVGGVHDPEEAFTQVAAAEGDGVDLEHTWLAGLVKPAWPRGDLGGECGFADGAFVRRARRQTVRSDESCDGGDAHAAQFVVSPHSSPEWPRP